jgi:hypothetical protein
VLSCRLKECISPEWNNIVKELIIKNLNLKEKKKTILNNYMFDKTKA